MQIKRVDVFGSLVKGKMHENSDIYIAIEYDTGKKYNFESFIIFCEFCEILSESKSKIYDRKIDVVEVEERQSSFLDDMQKEIIRI